MDVLRSPLHWILQASSGVPATVGKEFAHDGRSHIVEMEEGLVMASGPSSLAGYSPVSLSALSSPPCEVRPVPGKGLGLFTTRPVSAGELIISEMPLLRMKMSQMGYYRLEWEVNRLSQGKRSEFWKLHYTGMEELPELLEIWRRNSFSSGSGHQAVFKTISRINNSCTPNASVSWLDDPDDGKNVGDDKNEEQGRMNVYALRDIEEGKEITVCYTSVLHSRNARHEVLQETWEFACRCDACSLKGQELMQSEKRRRRAASILDHLNYEDRDKNEAFSLIKEGLDLLQQERLYGQLFSLSWLGYQYAALHEQWPEAKRWAGRAHEHSKLINGEDHPSTILCRRGVHTPQLHSAPGRTWGTSVAGECVMA